MRIMPRLDVKGEKLVKGIHLEGLKVLGSVEDFANQYYHDGADELLYIDAVASLYGRNSIHATITNAAKSIFVPLVVGGGIRTVDDITQVLQAGADKVAINSAAVNRPEFIREAASMFGSSTIAVSIDVKRGSKGELFVYTDNGRENSGKVLMPWAEQAIAEGAGEILITSIDRDGTGEGFSLEILESLKNKINVPLVVSGGFGNCNDVIEADAKCRLDGVAIGSMLHYALTEANSQEGQVKIEGGEFQILADAVTNQRIIPTKIRELKSTLRHVLGDDRIRI